jgi:hypothetical protein
VHRDSAMGLSFHYLAHLLDINFFPLQICE